jgi:hypothetical protein
MARLPKGWARLKEVGEVEPVKVLINRISGQFGTQLMGSEEIRPWATLHEAEAFITEINEAKAVEAVHAREPYGDQVPELVPLRVKRVGRRWVRMDGTALPWNAKLYVPDPAAAAAVEERRAAFEAARAAARQVREDAWEIVRKMQPLEEP